MLQADEVSHLHRLRSDEVWCFHAGDGIEVISGDEPVDADAAWRAQMLGPNGPYQLTIPAGAWFGARLPPGADWCLVGCQVAPGFDFADFELCFANDVRKLVPAEYHTLLQQLLNS